MAARLAYLLKKFPRLSETFILNELLGQERQGRSVHVFSRRRPDPEPRHPQLQSLVARVEFLPGIRELDPWRTLFSEEASGSDLVARVGALVGRWDEWSHPRQASLLSEALHVLRRSRELDLDHLHVHFASDAAVVAMLVRLLGGPSYSLTAHAKDIYRQDTNLPLLEEMFRQAEFVVTVCEANIRYLADRLSEESMSRVRLLYNGIDLTQFLAESEPTAARERNHILSVGRLVEKKGADVLLDALAILRRRGLDFEATLVGEGELRPQLEQRILELDLADRVHLTGGLDQARVRKLMARASVLCLPCKVGSDGNRDALPTVLIEALACGLPVISTPVSGIPEILGRGEAGVMVPENDAEATATAMLELLGDETARRRLARAGRLRAERYFDLERSAATLHTWFEAVLTERGQQCASPA